MEKPTTEITNIIFIYTTFTARNLNWLNWLRWKHLPLLMRFVCGWRWLEQYEMTKGPGLGMLT
jgi:hypothetical protein